ncbi:MAG TPA: DUF423 domain-containing protein [Usitatibacter sp.]|jgi:uncharacterized membrane protein YgdD (TMEM256/DUF423 family)|nr:DUF423 domain-containing protein [Usitatibacter sp.]
MTPVARLFIGGGALLLALAVALGAYSAHATKGAAHPEAARLLQTAVLYQFIHAMGILIAGVIARTGSSSWLTAAGLLHFAGIVLFCSSLWVLALTARSLGIAAPTGGMAFIAGWIALAVHALRS